MKNKSILRIVIVAIMIVVIIILAICIKKQATSSEPNVPSDVVVSEQGTEEVEEVELAQIPIDFDTLQTTQNSDIYAWISIPKTPVDNPILQSTKDDDYYLERTVDGKEGLPGSIYTQASLNTQDFSDKVTVIYGHNMRDKSFFGSLDEFDNEEYRNAHSTIMIYTPEKVFTYELAFAVTYNNKHILYNYDCNEDMAGYQEFLDTLKTDTVSPKWITDKFTLTTDDQIIILSTCNNNDAQRYLVGAKLVSVQDGEYVPSVVENTEEPEK